MPVPEFCKSLNRIEKRFQKAGLPLPQGWSRWRDLVSPQRQNDRDRIRHQDRRKVLLKSQSSFTVEIIEQTWEGGAWVNQEKTVMVYDDTGSEILSWTNQIWENGGWVNESRMRGQVNAAGQVTGIHFEEWKNGTWVPTMSWLMTYDAAGNETQIIIQIDENDDGVLENMVKLEMAYNALGQKTSEIGFFWDTGAWVKMVETFFTYNGLGLLVEERSQIDLGGGFVVFTGRTLYVYNASNLLETETEQGYDFATSAWVNENRTQYGYNAAGDNILLTTQTWDGTQWVNATRYTATYAAPGGNLLEERNEIDEGEWMDPGGSHLVRI